MGIANRLLLLQSIQGLRWKHEGHDRVSPLGRRSAALLAEAEELIEGKRPGQASEK
jgi:hypothetical protein